MARQDINLGTAPTGVGGDTTRSTAVKINAMTTELYAITDSFSNGTGRPRVAGIGVAASVGGYTLQGGYMGWNGAEASGFNGEMHFICNRGGGTGGFVWRSVNATNTAGGPTMTYSYAGVLSVSQIDCTSGAGINANGYRIRTGATGVSGGSVFNFNWGQNGLESWIDTTKVGNVSFVTSDRRIKKDIETLEGISFLDRIDTYRVVTYKRKKFDIWGVDDENQVYQGLIADEAQQANPLAAGGVKDGVDEFGNTEIQQLDPMVLITDLIGGLQETRAEIKALREELIILKSAPPAGSEG